MQLWIGRGIVCLLCRYKMAVYVLLIQAKGNSYLSYRMISSWQLSNLSPLLKITRELNWFTSDKHLIILYYTYNLNLSFNKWIQRQSAASYITPVETTIWRRGLSSSKLPLRHWNFSGLVYINGIIYNSKNSFTKHKGVSGGLNPSNKHKYPQGYQPASMASIQGLLAGANLAFGAVCTK